MARRGFFAELQHQAKMAAREQERAERAAERDYKAALRRAEQARKAQERADTQLIRATAAENKRLAKAAREAHVAAMIADAEMRNLQLAEIFDEVDSLLEATLEVDDYVDLDSLRTVAQHAAFNRPDLEVATPAPIPCSAPPQPELNPPEPPKGMRALFGKGKHTKAVAKAKKIYKQKLAAWQAKLDQMTSAHESAIAEHAHTEAQRIEALDLERTRYASECATRDAEAASHNEAVDKLIANLGYGTTDAVQEYVSIVLSNSVYPPHFLVDHQFTFDSSTAELKLRVVVPGPDKVPNIKSYKYTKSSDEITSTQQSQKASKDRYANAVNAVAIRSIHEVFEADRRGIIKTISLEVGTETIDPATGRETYVLFVATGAERDSFLQFDLSCVVPAATLTHLGACVSKNPFGLVAANSAGIRKS